MTSIVWRHGKVPNTDKPADGPHDPVDGYVGCAGCDTKSGEKRFRISHTDGKTWRAVDQSRGDHEHFRGSYEQCIDWCYRQLTPPEDLT